MRINRRRDVRIVPRLLRRVELEAGRVTRRTLLVVYAVGFALSLFSAAARYPDVRYHGVLGSWPWPLYLVAAFFWGRWWWEVKRRV